MPTILPNEAPIAIDGTKIPAGTLQPYEMMTRNIRNTVAMASEKTIDQRFFTLSSVSREIWLIKMDSIYYSLAKPIIVVTTFTLKEEYFHTLSHVNPQKQVRIANYRCTGSQ